MENKKRKKIILFIDIYAVLFNKIKLFKDFGNTTFCS